MSNANKRLLKGMSKVKDEYDDSDDEDLSEDEEDYEEEKVSKKTKRLRKTKNDRRPKKKQKKFLGAKMFIEEQAEEASDDYEDEEDDDEVEVKDHQKNQYYNENDLKRKYNQNILPNLEEKYKNMDEGEDGFLDEEDQEEEEDEMIGLNKQKLLPSVNDPRLWQVRVKRGTERQATMSLMNKSIDMALKGNHLSILSVTCSENVEGFIYVEAFKEIHVKEAIKGLSVILGGKAILIQKEEMPGIYQNDRKMVQLKKNSWVRIKSGLYANDLGLVENHVNNKIWIRLVPRLELPQKNQAKYGTEKVKKSFSYRTQQKFFNPQQFQCTDFKKDNDLGKTFNIYKKQMFRKGFLYKQFPFKGVQYENVRPSVEEVQTFASNISKNNKEQDSSDDDGVKGEDLIKKTFLDSNSTDINKGDKIRITKGDLNGLNGTVITIENGYVLFKPSIEGFNENLKLEASFVVKYFEAGDQVRVVDGKYKGETGIVVTTEGSYASIALAQSNREIKILANYLKLKSEIDQSVYQGFIDQKKANEYHANDLLSYDNNKHVGVVLQVQEDYLKVINDSGEIKNIKIGEVNKKFERDRKASTVDSQRNTLYPDNVVKIIAGKYKGRKGVIRYIFKNVLFLWDKEFQQSHGIFVENTSNVLILGDEHIKQNEGAAASMNRRTKDQIVGKEIMIIGGEWKGYRGRVCKADDKQAIVELTSKCRKIPIEKSLIQDIKDDRQTTTRDDMSYGGQTVYEAGKTPMQHNTPSYYPHSPHWGAGQSPAFGTEYEFNGGMSPGFSRPGSEHRPTTPRNNYNQIKKE